MFGKYIFGYLANVSEALTYEPVGKVFIFLALDEFWKLDFEAIYVHASDPFGEQFT